MKKVFSLLLFACVLVSCSVEEPGSRLSEGEYLPDFSAVTMDGKTVSSASLLGKPSVIVFFNAHDPDSWCQMVEIHRLWNYFTEQINIVAIAHNDTVVSVSEYFGKKGFSMPVVVPKDKALYDLFDRGTGVEVPFLYVCTAKGLVVLCGDGSRLITAYELAGAAGVDVFVIHQNS